MQLSERNQRRVHREIDRVRKESKSTTTLFKAIWRQSLLCNTVTICSASLYVGLPAKPSQVTRSPAKSLLLAPVYDSRDGPGVDSCRIRSSNESKSVSGSSSK